MRHKIVIVNAKLVLPDKIVAGKALVIRDKKIIAITRAGKFPPSIQKINARGNFVAPGFIDLHIHGDILKVSQTQVQGGTCGFLATLHPEKPKALLQSIARAKIDSQKASGAKVLGLRLEGPFLNREFGGALPLEALRSPDLAEARRIIKQAGLSLKMVILAPELKNALNLIRLFNRNKIITSLGHTGATYQEMLKGVEAGASHVTHMFNRIRGFEQREPGALACALVDQRLKCEVIADGIHVHPAALKLLLLCKGLDRIMLITDSTVAQKLPAKKRAGSVFKLKDGTLYGTALTLNQAVKNSIKFLGLSIPEAVRLAALNPARLLKIDKMKGSIAVGKYADLVVFDRDLNVVLTMVEGNVRYRRLHR